MEVSKFGSFAVFSGLTATPRNVVEHMMMVSNVDYNATGQVIKIEYGNGTATENTYDPLTLRLKRRYTYDGTGKAIQDLEYEYDGDGGRTRKMTYESYSLIKKGTLTANFLFHCLLLFLSKEDVKFKYTNFK